MCLVCLISSRSRRPSGAGNRREARPSSASARRPASVPTCCPHCARLAKRSPGVDITVGILNSVEAIARLQAGTLELEIGIIAMPRPLARGETRAMVAMVPRSWNPPKRTTPQWLAERPWISFDPATHMYRLIATRFWQAGLKSPGPYAPQLARSHQKPSRGRTSVNHAASPLQSAETPSWTGSRYAPPGSRCQRAR